MRYLEKRVVYFLFSDSGHLLDVRPNYMLTNLKK